MQCGRRHSLCERPAPRRPAGEPWTWIYSGNLGRAHEWEALLAAQQIIERTDAGIRLVFQGGGPSWAQAQERARTLELKNVEWRPYAEEKLLVESLLACHASVVTQRPETAGLLWPSKLGLVLTLPRPLLFVGSPDGAIARDLRRSRHAGVFAPSQVEADRGLALGTKAQSGGGVAGGDLRCRRAPHGVAQTLEGDCCG